MSAGKPTYIPIREDVPQLVHRPPLAVSVVKELAIRAAAPLFRRLNTARHRTRERDLQELLTKAAHCRSRNELEAVLGQPAYSLSGHDFTITEANGKSHHPDHVEVYLVSGCTIDVLFFPAEGRFEMHGFPSPTSTDIVLGFKD